MRHISAIHYSYLIGHWISLWFMNRSVKGYQTQCTHRLASRSNWCPNGCNITANSLICVTFNYYLTQIQELWYLTQIPNIAMEIFFKATLFGDSLIFIRPFEKRTYYAMAMSVRLSVRPSVRPSEFSGLFFNMLWDINFKLGICI